MFVHTEVCSQQLGLCSHGDGCEGLWESNLQEVIAAGWSICGMRMAPEGLVVDVQLAICCNPAARARKPPRNHTGRTAFPNARARDSACCPGSSSAHPRHWASDALSGTSRKHPQLERWLCAVHLLVRRMRPLEWKRPQHGSLSGQRSLLFLISGQVLGLFYSAPNRQPITRLRHWRPVHKA